jgi:hypothetical protein
VSGAPLCLTVDWPAPAGVRAAFSTRHGGASRAPWASLNLGSHVGDDPAAVAANRAALGASLGLSSEPCWLEQIHSDILLDLDDPTCDRRGDAAITTTPGRVATVMVADCLPVLLCDVHGRQVAAVHAGWRGLACELIGKTVAAFAARPAELYAWLGPAIGPTAYEVSADLRAQFLDLDARHADAFHKRGAKWHMNLARVAQHQLADAGVRNVTASGVCVHSDAQNYFSYRRDGETGRMAAMVWLEDSA